jgi:hypothetical protein
MTTTQGDRTKHVNVSELDTAASGSWMVSLNARPKAVEIDLARTAIVVVDMQNAYASKGGMLDIGTGIDEARVGAVIDANKRLLAAARAAGVKVIYLQFGYKADLSDAGGPHSPNIRKQMAFKLIKERPEVRDKLIIEGTGFRDRRRPQAGTGRSRRQEAALQRICRDEPRGPAPRPRHPAPDLHWCRHQRLRGEHRARRLFPRVLADPGRGRDGSHWPGFRPAGDLVQF